MNEENLDVEAEVTEAEPAETTEETVTEVTAEAEGADTEEETEADTAEAGEGGGDAAPAPEEEADGDDGDKTAELFPDLSAEEIAALKARVQPEEERDGEEGSPEPAPAPAPAEPEPAKAEPAPEPAKEEPAKTDPLGELQKRALKAMGEDPDSEDKLYKIIADYEGVPEEDVRKEYADQLKAPEAEPAKQEPAKAEPSAADQNAANEAIYAADLAEIKAAIPAYAGLTSVQQLPDYSQFCALRRAGVSAANAAKLIGGFAERSVPKDSGKGHLHSSVPTGSAESGSDRLSDADVARFRDQLGFESMSDKEIRDLYRRTRK